MLKSLTLIAVLIFSLEAFAQKTLCMVFDNTNEFVPLVMYTVEFTGDGAHQASNGEFDVAVDVSGGRIYEASLLVVSKRLTARDSFPDGVGRAILRTRKVQGAKYLALCQI